MALEPWRHLGKRLAAALLLVLALVAHPAGAQTPRSAASAITEDSRLIALFREDQRREQMLDPLQLLFHGAEVPPGELRRVFTDEQLRLTRQSAQQSMAALKRIDRRRLTPQRQISYDVFLDNKREELEWLAPDMIALTAVRPMDHFGGLHIEFPSIMAANGAVSYDSEADYWRNLAVLRMLPVMFANAELRFRQGLDSGVVETRLTTANMIAQIDALLAQPQDQSPFLSPVASFPEGVPEAHRAQLRQAYGAALRDDVLPAYRRLRKFLNDEYLPAAREAVGLSAMKGGAGLYRRLIEKETTLSLDPEAVHQLGLAEVARIQREMEQVKVKLGYSGNLKGFFEEVRTNPRYHPQTAQELADGFAKAARAVDAHIPRLFLHTPATRLEIQPYPEYRAKYDAGGSYNEGSADGSRPGVFFYNTYDLPSRFLTGITTLYLHEGAPGHHFQISLAQEDKSLPDFQRFGGNNAYVEGWALYAETLGHEMGLYRDPMQHWGTLDDEMLRAMRLVVDTGLHARGWSREQAIAYMLANSGMGRSDATAEVERYIAWPAQALSYKIGALTIQRLRRKAEAALGARFDLRQFHAQVLESGALPLPVLEAKINRWITAGG
ncbi:DUF885 domain-containing protein [Novosphingobium sp. B 225]|uniref:DUF885 domain-containing protein n=1 Tax=Novosphingobium sp. B 225 TaxID=1961849 RepID=UPI0020CD539A|nr:DUF885 domain-containing protein [Novosphingobium sp. B 225]